jgi:hypothetical protein
MVDGVRYHPSWPGLSSREGCILHSGAGLATVTRTLANEVAALDEPHNAGSLPDFRGAMQGFAPSEDRLHHFGDWRTARRLSSAQLSAMAHALAIYSGVLRNIEQFGARVRATSEHYRQAEHNIAAAANGRGAVGEAGQLRASFLPRSEPVAGVFSVPRHRPLPETADEYDPDTIAVWLGLLHEHGAEGAHHEMSIKWQAVAEAVQRLCDALFRQAVELHNSWQDKASPLAQHKLRRIEGTAQTLASFAWDLKPLARYSAEALHEALAVLQHGSIRWHSTGRRSRINAAFDQLNGRYREIIGAYPASVAFDLPFGQLPPRSLEPAAPEPAPRSGADPPPPADPFQAPSVIGGDIPRSWTFDFDGNHWLDDAGPDEPGFVGQ